jgi:hypothetical protein
MKPIFSLLTLLFVINTVSFSQELSQEDIMLSESILIQKSYHIDLPAYDRAKLIVDHLIKETSLQKQEIIDILDQMVVSSSSVTKLMLERFHGLPVYVNTGNPELDKKNYKNAKNEWIENNPSKYQELVNSNTSQK